jgi:hypothetical protein
MNAGHADTRSSHLDLEDLIAEVTGQPIDSRAREHLARCEQCRGEAKRWDLVAGGVRSLTAATPLPEPPAHPRHTPPHILPRITGGARRRTKLAAGAAAALVLLGAAGYGASTALTRHAGGTVLTAVGGCAGLEQASGTLVRVKGTSLVIGTAGGQLATVTTTPSTFVNLSGPLLSNITAGASVEVRGHSSGGTIAAAIVTVGQPFSVVNPAGFVPVQGTVSDPSTSGFTLVTSGGTQIPVTTSGATLVIVPHASLSQLKAGTTVVALGHAGPDGTLSAQGVVSITQPATGGQLSVHASATGCSPASIAAGLLSGA